MYMMAKHLHLTALVLSILLFVARFAMMQMQMQAANNKFMKIAPHIAYTVLVATAVWLCMLLSIYPFTTSWVTFKLLGLIAFIVMGLVAFKWGKTKLMQWVGFLGALAWLAVTAKVAVTKQPLWF
ncbi:invasion protein [Alteromonas sediminis]|uniref:Invasion protein n=2 Tax=Alteromonas sediminis TaxID=2259342 RepID=A0A3N5Y1S8_9ALTE|nr:invasion protein [Alteromonas sediminis]